MTEIQAKVDGWTQRAQKAARSLSTANSTVKNDALLRLAELLEERQDEILTANNKDLAEHGAHLDAAMTDRLRLTPERIMGIAEGVREIAALPDPVGETSPGHVRPNGLRVMQMRIPLGVILMIFESRPNVTIDAGALCLKSGNAVILRGGKESLHSCLAFRNLFALALREAGLDSEAVQVIDDPDRAIVGELLSRAGEIDLVIPRGGEGLIRTVTEQSRIPVIQHFKGVCHVYLHGSASLDKACAIAVNAKTHRPGVCNAMETLLVDRQAEALLPAVAEALRDAGVTLYGCKRTQEICPWIEAASPEDWDKEYLSLELTVKVVDNLEAACTHIANHGSNHTEAIVADDWDACLAFMQQIQSSTVIINASTRFADGGQLGLGAEIGISTSKLHAYGPMGLRELTTQKFVVLGNGQIRS